MDSMQVVVHGVLNPDGTLQLRQPVNLPPGEVRVTVETVKEPSSREDVVTVLERIRAEQRTRGHVPRTREEVDAEISAMRDEAEEQMQQIERIAVPRGKLEDGGKPSY